MNQFFPRKRTRLSLWLRKYRFFCLAAIVFLGSMPVAADQYVASVAAGGVYEEVANVPERRVALVLGTTKWAPSGRVNLFYQHRIEAALELYREGKVERILVSGDNSRLDNNEPTLMRDDLVTLGIPSNHIVLDYAGFRTLDSVIRAQKVFGLTAFVVVSQRFHCLRAVYLAKASGVDAIGYCAKDVGGSTGVRIRLREVFARTMAIVDIEVLGREPKFLGDPEAIL